MRSISGYSNGANGKHAVRSSSCGTRMSSAAIGHTGFTGTSLWLDPTADAYVVLLSNRIHPSRGGDGIRRVRSAVHDAIMEAVRAA